MNNSQESAKQEVFEKQVLILMLGHPGSGKSYFTKQLAPKLHAVRFNADHMRTSMYDDPDDVRNRANNPYVFGAIDYAVYETLKAGHTVICDRQYNYVSERLKSKAIADQFNVPTIVVWIKTPYDIALKRGQDRPEAPDQRKKTDEQMRGSLDRFIKVLEQPTPDEHCVIIDGTESFDEQFSSYQEQVAQIIDATT